MRLLMGLLVALFTGFASGADWRSASHAPVGLAPEPAATPEAVIQVYGARVWGLKGLFGVHTWVAVKPTKAKHWTVYEVIGWRLRWSDSVVVVSDRDPDARWYGNAPELYAEKRGAGVDEMIARVDKAARSYPFAQEYGLWPGPNSNTFVQAALDAVPELKAVLPPTAIGKDYPYRGAWFGLTASGTGVFASLGGYLGLTVGWVEGIELNFFGGVLGLDLRRPALKFPGLGRIGVPLAP